MKEQVPKYPLLVELNKSISGGKHAIVWSKKLWERDTTETATGLTWWRDLSAPWRVSKVHETEGRALNINWRIPDKFQWSRQMILATSKVGWEDLCLIKEQVLEYPLCVELPRSILEKPWKMEEQKSVSEARKQVKSSKLPWWLTWWRLMKSLSCLHGIWKERESTRLRRSLEYQLEDSWQVSVISTNDSCNAESQLKRPSSHEGARSQIPTLRWTP